MIIVIPTANKYGVLWIQIDRTRVPAAPPIGRAAGTLVLPVCVHNTSLSFGVGVTMTSRILNTYVNPFMQSWAACHPCLLIR